MLEEYKKIFDEKEMSSVDRAAVLFGLTQTEEKFKRENVQTQEHATLVYNQVGAVVRQARDEMESRKTPGGLQKRK